MKRSGSPKASRPSSRIHSAPSTHCAPWTATSLRRCRTTSWPRSRQEAIDLIDHKLHAVGLSYEEFAGKYPSEFSGGQLQRISIARALLTDPKLLIADEPVSMVDASLRMSIVNLFKKLRDELGVSMLYITHDLATAYYVSDRIAIMFRGNIVEMGTVEQVLMNPRHPYTKLLRESIPEADPSRRWQGRDPALTDTEQDEYMQQGCRFAGRCPFVMDICRQGIPPDILSRTSWSNVTYTRKKVRPNYDHCHQPLPRPTRPVYLNSRASDRRTCSRSGRAHDAGREAGPARF